MEIGVVLLFYSDTGIKCFDDRISLLEIFRQSVAFGQLVDSEISLYDSC